MSEPSRKVDRRIDRTSARRRFERAAATYAKPPASKARSRARMLERLDYVKLAPRRILDAASGPPRRALGKRYPGARVIALDFALGMLRPRGFAFSERILAVCADLERLPLAAGGDRSGLVQHGAALAAGSAAALARVRARARPRRAAHVQHARARHAEGAARGGRRVARACVHRHARPRRHAGRGGPFGAR